ncbi:MAG: peptidoglycan-binding protein [Peptococcaceae bacterium]|nr:peptidoglycan-binding protein [Peptococcaceae bacterium]
MKKDVPFWNQVSFLLLFLLTCICFPAGEVRAAGTGPALSLGSRGPEVRTIQERLKLYGCYPDGEVSGYFGLTTLAAVVAFEKAAGLPADGVVGEAEWQLLAADRVPSRSDWPGGSGNTYTKLKRTVLGYYTEDYPGDRLSYDSLAGNSDFLDAIATFSFLTDGRGNLTGQPVSQGMDLAKSRKVKTLMLVHNYSGGFDSGLAHTVLSVQENRVNLEKNILSSVKKHGFDGVNIDLEGLPAADRASYSALLAELKELFKPYGYLLTVSIPAKTGDDPAGGLSGAYDYRTIGSYADLVMLMTYDEHWFGGEPGPVASLPWVQQVLDYAVQTIPRDKILMGVAAYGYDWSAAGTRTVLWSRAGALAARYGGAGWDDWYSSPYLIYYDENGNRHEVWYENRFSLSLKLDLANSYNIGGIAVWRLGFEDDSFWQTVREKFS